MRPNPTFVEALRQRVDRDSTILFICRSGNRSRDAAIAMTAAGYPRCYNVRDGFDGQRDAHGHRGHGGWRAAGLPWVQD
ncbi:MAG: hypothetical protein GWN84_04485 [Gammaproteobacteria bacterium]|nr:hypothetical protein [Gammaproteobacteria bacterium]NIR82237.1 hypothetical protein [Gammaproteobacteria bacterium]